MSTRAKTNLAKYGGCVVFTALLIWTHMGSQDFAGMTLRDQYCILCDSFSIPGLLMMLFGGLVWVSNQGALDGISYCLRLLVCTLIPGKRAEGYEKYSEYVEKKSQKRVSGYAFLFLCGAVDVIIAAIFLVLYHLQ